MSYVRGEDIFELLNIYDKGHAIEHTFEIDKKPTCRNLGT